MALSIAIVDAIDAVDEDVEVLVDVEVVIIIVVVVGVVVVVDKAFVADVVVEEAVLDLARVSRREEDDTSEESGSASPERVDERAPV